MSTLQRQGVYIKMIGWHHAVVILAGMIGLMIGGSLIDLDHYTNSGKNNLKCKWAGFIGTHGQYEDCATMNRSRLHNPVLMLSMALFFIMLGLGILIHYLMDYMHVPGYN